MISKDQIKLLTLQIAKNYDYSGESVEMITDIVTYIVYHNQFDILNAVQESSLATAKLMNSKIKACMDVMYSVYRGRNAKVRLNFKNNTLINFSKFDVVYESNGFKLYSESAVSYSPSIALSNGEYSLFQLDCIFCKSTKFELELTVSESTRYYIDAIIDNSYLKNISEDIKVTIDGIEYPTTRNFFDHINQTIYNPNEPISENNPLDSLFVLTIPDYGFRIFKKGYRKDENGVSTEVGYFKPNQVINIQGLEYTELKDINMDEVSRIIIPGTNLIPFGGLMPDNITPIIEGDEGRKLISEIQRESSESILYNANLSTRLQSQIYSNSDINALFSEYFIEQILSSINWYDNVANTLYIYYIPRFQDLTISTDQINLFIEKYKSYFITQNIVAIKGLLCNINVELVIYLNDNKELTTEIQNIFNKYSNRLNSIDAVKSIVNEKAILAEITKLPSVNYVDNMTYIKFDIESESPMISPTTPIPTFILDQDTQVKIPLYYAFELVIIYKNSYGTTS